VIVAEIDPAAAAAARGRIPALANERSFASPPLAERLKSVS
jgi:hypothetical protein